MRETLLLFKVVLLLAAFISSSSSYAATQGDHNLLGNSLVDFTIVLGNQTTEDDELTFFSPIELFFSTQISAPVLDYHASLVKDLASKPFARAPPVSTLA